MLEARDENSELPPGLADAVRDLGLGEVTGSTMLNGGAISLTRRLTTSSGERVVVKQSTQAPADLYTLEAEGLRVLREAGLRVPAVFGATADYLLLEDLATPEGAEIDWEALGRAFGSLHLHHGERFGFHHDNYLGLLPHHNGWMTDGHEFFAQNRILNFLPEPHCQTVFTVEELGRIERLAAKLPEIMPVQPPSLLHGDFWVVDRDGVTFGNVVVDSTGTPALVDPAVYYGWAEAELGMFHQYGGTPDSPFYAAYLEVNPLEDGWEERLPLMGIREWLSVVAHMGPEHDMTVNAARAVRELCDRYL
jgi:fructosamine-3-kinase